MPKAMSAAMLVEMPAGTWPITGSQTAVVHPACLASGALASAVSANRRGCLFLDVLATVLNRFSCSGSRPSVVACCVMSCASCGYRTKHAAANNFICMSAAWGLASWAPPRSPTSLATEASASCWGDVFGQPAKQANPPSRLSGLRGVRLFSSA